MENLPVGPLTYKDSLLKSIPASKWPELLPPLKKTPAPRSRHPLARLDLKSRCFMFLASDHRIRDCRDPRRCAVCLRTGHRARQCQLQASLSPPKMHMGGDFRPHLMKVFIPLSEDFHNGQLQRQCAVLADVIGRANLGHFPQ